MKFRDASEVEKQTEMVPSVRAQVTYESEGKIRYVPTVDESSHEGQDEIL